MKSKQQRQRIEERRIRREQSLCLDCGSDDLAFTASGDRSRYCTAHLAIHSTAHRNNTQLQPVRGVVELTDYRDTSAFAQYRDEIQALFAQHRRLSIPEIHRLVAEPKRHWTMDVLDTMDLIEHGAQPVKYEVYAPTIKERPGKKGFNRLFLAPTDKSRPAVESFERERSVSA